MDNINHLEENEYIKERVKATPLNRRKLMRRTIITASMAVIFGVLACLTFLVLQPVFTNMLYPQEEPAVVEIPEDTEEMLPEDMVLEEESEPQIQVIERNYKADPIQMYDDQYEELYSIAQTALASTVTVIGYNSEMDWFDNSYESKTSSSGFYVANNRMEMLFLSHKDVIMDASDILVTFHSGESVKGEIKGVDENTGLAVIAVKIEDVPEQLRESIQVLKLANSKVSNILATPVIAIGQLYDQGEAVGYGMLAGKGKTASFTDQNVEILTTDIYGGTNASGVILNLHGEVLGVIDSGMGSEAAPNLVTAIGISDIKQEIERMSNGRSKSVLGINGIDVSKEAIENLGVPMGAYVTSIVMSSPAMNAGIQSGDIITKIGERTILKYSDVTDAMYAMSPETTVYVTVMRQGGEEYKELVLEVTLGEVK